MAPRKSTKNPSQAIIEALDTPLEATVVDTAVGMGLTSAQLRERLAAKLDNDDPLDWETIPGQHQPLVEAIARDLESEASVRRLTPSQVAPEVPVEAEIPLIEEEVPQKGKGKGGKLAGSRRNATEITHKSQKAIDLELKNAHAIEYGIDKTEEIISLQNEFEKGAHEQKKKELAKINGRLKVREAAHKKALLAIKKESEQRSEEDILLSLKAAGIQTSEELLEDIKSFSEVALGKFQGVFEEHQDNPWASGYESDSTAEEEFENWNV